MSYVTRNPETDEPTVWLNPEDVTDEWARVKKLRSQPFSLAEGLHANKEPTYPYGLNTGRLGHTNR